MLFAFRWGLCYQCGRYFLLVFVRVDPGVVLEYPKFPTSKIPDNYFSQEPVKMFRLVAIHKPQLYSKTAPCWAKVV